MQPISDKNTVAPELVPSESSSSVDGDAHRLRNGVIWTVALAVILLAVGLAVPDLRGVLHRVSRASPGWLVLGLALEIASCLGYVAVVRLVLHRAPARDVRRLAWAEMAFGAVVPAGGAGGLAVGAWAMRAWGISWSRIANRSAVIFLFTSAVNGAVLGLSGLGVWAGIGSARTGALYGLVPAAGAILALGVFLLLPLVAIRLGPDTRAGGSLVRRLGSWVRDTEAVAFQRDRRVLGSVSYLLFDMAVLWTCLRAVGTHPPLLALLVGYQLGYLSNLVPVPGGVGVLEGGLLGALVLYGLPAAPTAAAVVMYHAIALWVPTIGGTVGFVRLRKTLSVASGSLRALPAERSAPPATSSRELAA